MSAYRASFSVTTWALTSKWRFNRLVPRFRESLSVGPRPLTSAICQEVAIRCVGYSYQHKLFGLWVTRTQRYQLKSREFDEITNFGFDPMGE
eukprot:2214254-Pyramimonas_sp.AAC.1